MYEEILVPTDGSDASLDAVDEAAELADEQGARIHVLYVLDLTMLADADSVTVVDAMEASGEEAIEQARTRAREQGVEAVEASVKRGTPYRAILEYADENDIGLVVMGTHGRTGLNRLLLGSVTEKLVRLSPVPVLTVRPGREGVRETAEKTGTDGESEDDVEDQ